MKNIEQSLLFELEDQWDKGSARSLLDQLLADSKVYKSTDSYKALLEFVIRLRNVAPFNAMLLQLQKPGLTYAASAHDWRSVFKREVKEDANAGRIRLIIGGEDDKDKSYLIKINRNHNPAVQFTTLAHELGHLFLGHLGSNKLLSAPKRGTLSHATREIEAESVAYLVCERNGVKTKSEAYLANFVTGGMSADNLDLYRITHAAGHVESILGLSMHTQFPRKK